MTNEAKQKVLPAMPNPDRHMCWLCQFPSRYASGESAGASFLFSFPYVEMHNAIQ